MKSSENERTVQFCNRKKKEIVRVRIDFNSAVQLFFCVVQTKMQSIVNSFTVSTCFRRCQRYSIMFFIELILSITYITMSTLNPLANTSEYAQ